jgi:Double zinc ribbon
VLCPSCGDENRDGRKFCAGCGAELTLACSLCGAKNRPGERFCGECGKPLAPASAPAGPRAPRSYTPKHLAHRGRMFRHRSLRNGSRWRRSSESTARRSRVTRSSRRHGLSISADLKLRPPALAMIGVARFPRIASITPNVTIGTREGTTSESQLLREDRGRHGGDFSAAPPSLEPTDRLRRAQQRRLRRAAPEPGSPRAPMRVGSERSAEPASRH